MSLDPRRQARAVLVMENFRKKLGSNAASLSGTQYLKNYVELEELRPASALPLERRTLTKSVEPLLSLDDLTQHAGNWRRLPVVHWTCIVMIPMV